MKEFELKGKHFIVDKPVSSRSPRLITDDFVVTLDELRLLKAKFDYSSNKTAAYNLYKSEDTISGTLKKIKKKNKEITGISYNTSQLILKAEEYELLNELTILGLEVALKEKKS
jgi:nucleoid-associated protein YejK